MSEINENKTFLTVKEIAGKYGVSQKQFRNIAKKIKDEDFELYNTLFKELKTVSGGSARKLWDYERVMEVIGSPKERNGLKQKKIYAKTREAKVVKAKTKEEAAKQESKKRADDKYRAKQQALTVLDVPDATTQESVEIANLSKEHIKKYLEKFELFYRAGGMIHEFCDTYGLAYIPFQEFLKKDSDAEMIFDRAQVYKNSKDAEDLQHALITSLKKARHYEETEIVKEEVRPDPETGDYLVFEKLERKRKTIRDIKVDKARIDTITELINEKIRINEAIQAKYDNIEIIDYESHFVEFLKDCKEANAIHILLNVITRDKTLSKILIDSICEDYKLTQYFIDKTTQSKESSHYFLKKIRSNE